VAPFNPRAGAIGMADRKQLNVAVQMDPIERINIRGDSTFALLLEAERREFALSYYTPDQMALLDGEVFATVRPLKVRDIEGDHFTLGEAQRTTLAAFDVILMRQDPPFDLAYITATHLLERVQPRTLVVNDPAQVRNAPEKLFVTAFPDLMPPTLITRNLAEIKAFRARHGDIVMKPLHGHGGAAVFALKAEDVNFGSLYDLFAATFREPWVVQKYLPAVKLGDKRIILVDGAFAGAVNRVPQADDLRSNMVRGGAAQAAGLTARESEICERLGPALRERGLLFTGIDVIDGHLTEINVTSPTGIRAIRRLGGPDIAALIWDRIVAKRAGQHGHSRPHRPEGIRVGEFPEKQGK
jgi:glutathione synthase